MVEETTLNIDLNDPRSLQVAEIITNPSCKKILNILAQKELTETEISKELKMPLNTVDYNIKKLVKSGLVESTNHFWSIKGKRIPSYRAANKKIVISPSKFDSKLLSLPILSSLFAVFVLARRFVLNKSLGCGFIKVFRLLRRFCRYYGCCSF
jgi:DNA-binding transcriptional ArsR family regulator